MPLPRRVTKAAEMGSDAEATCVPPTQWAGLLEENLVVHSEVYSWPHGLAHVEAIFSVREVMRTINLSNRINKPSMSFLFFVF